MNAFLLRIAVTCVRVWTRLYTGQMAAASREARRAEIESDLWEFQRDAARDRGFRPACHVLFRLLIGIPDDLGWRLEQAAVAGTLAQGSLAMAGRVAGAVFFMGSLWVIDADAGRHRPVTPVVQGVAVLDYETEDTLTARARSTPGTGRRLAVLIDPFRDITPGESYPCGYFGPSPAIGLGSDRAYQAIRGMTMDDLALRLSPYLGRRVIDATGLSGYFDADFEFTVEIVMPPPPPGQPNPYDGRVLPSIFSVLPQQLGLKLESQWGAVDVLIIDHAEHPTED